MRLHYSSNANAKFDYYVLENSGSHMNTDFMYIFMKSSFAKHDLKI